MGVLRFVALGAQLLVHLRAEAVHQHQLDAHGLDQRQILHDALQLACGNRLAGDAHHEGLVSELVDIGSHRPEPGDKGEIEDSGHGVGLSGLRDPMKAKKKRLVAVRPQAQCAV
ncbi:hypothetical protein SDC9_193981 [bioreactor metagenome]|uniref:Uncharacterized protein n=1 Tax=bioreactor metagenome TaxID=1076179 RepID=A0A645I514_9ZZZZ